MEHVRKLEKNKQPPALVSFRKKPISVTIGIDFGTSFTKVCFSEGKSFDFVLFNGSEYKPSIIYYDHGNNRLYSARPSNIDTEEILYFKYSIIEESLPKGKMLSKAYTTTKPEILCGVFYLASLINESKKYIQNHFSNIMKHINIEWSITMGVPIDNYESDHKNLYDKILHIANSLSNDIGEYSVGLSYIDTYYREHETISIPKYGTSPINTLPELYAELLAFLQNRNVLNSVYALMDVGGGTVDLAVMFKEEKEIYSIVAKSIKPFGIEIVSNNMINNARDIEQIRKALKNKYKLSAALDINIDKEHEYKEKLRIAFAELVIEVKKKNTRSYLERNNGILQVIICGGGADHKWYEDIVNQNRTYLRPILPGRGLELKIIPTEKLLPESLHINHRLLISYILSQPIEYIPQVDGFPWHFAELKNTVTNVNVFDRYYSLQDRMRELYGETL
jgi:hypothetical protein